jgi:hypothetical protein
MNLPLASSLKTTLLSTLLMSAGAASAHDGHGLGGSHWHSTDVAGFVALAVAVALALWFSRGGK